MTDCSICMDKIKEEYITTCYHKFCNKCFMEWIMSNDNCPICRKQLTKYDIESRLNLYETPTRYNSVRETIYITNYLDRSYHCNGFHYNHFLKYLDDLHDNIIKNDEPNFYTWKIIDNIYTTIIKKKNMIIYLNVDVFNSKKNKNNYYYTIFGEIYDFKNTFVKTKNKDLNYRKYQFKNKKNKSFKY